MATSLTCFFENRNRERLSTLFRIQGSQSIGGRKARWPSTYNQYINVKRVSLQGYSPY